MRGESPTGRVLVDTNVLIYATLSQDRRNLRALEVLGWRDRADVELFVSVQNLAEMYPNLTGPKTTPPDSPELARRKIESIAGLAGVTILPVTWETIREALELCERYGVRRQRYFDLQLVALMLRHGIGTVITENVADFAAVDGIRVVNPF